MPRRGRLRKLFQWQLSSVMVLTAVIGVGLAIYVRWIAPYRTQFDAREKLEALGGSFEVVEAEPAWMETLVGKKRFHRLVAYRNENKDVSDTDIRPIADLPHLERLYLNGTSVGDQGARYIGRLQNLRRLSLWRTQITDAGLPHIAQCSKLQVLDLHTNCITDRGLKSLEPLQNLRQLTLGGAVCGPGLESVARLPQLARLDLQRSAVSLESLSQLAGSSIEELWIGNEVPASAVEHLAGMPRLREFHGTIVAATDETARLLSQCTDLRRVAIGGNRMTDAATAHLATLPRLTDLEIRGNLTDQSITRIESMDQLENAFVTGRFSIDALDRVAQSRPNLNMGVCTILPNAYYTNLPQLTLSTNPPDFNTLRQYIQEPLIHVWGASHRFVNTLVSRPLAPRVNFPANLQDLASLTVLHQRLEIVELLNSVDYRSQFDRYSTPAASNSVAAPLDGIEKFQNLQRLRIDGDGCRNLRLLEQLPNLTELTIQDASFTDTDLEALRLPPLVKKFAINAPRVSREGIQRLRERYPDITLVDEGKSTSNRNWSSNRGQPPPDHVLTGTHQPMVIRITGARTTIDCNRFAQLNDLRAMLLSGYTPCRRLWRLDKPLPKLEQLTLNIATDCDLAQLQYCPSLKILQLDRTSISDNAFQHLAETPQLQRLSLGTYETSPYGPWITGRELSGLLACRDLEYLNLSGTPVRGKYLAELAPLDKLTEIMLSATNIGDEDCKFLAQLPALEILTLSRTSITDSGLQDLAACPKLQHLDISWTDVTDRGLSYLPKCTTLNYVKVRNTEMTPEAITRFMERFPTVRVQNR